MRILSYMIWLLIIIIGLTFASLNSEPVTLNYYFGIHSISLSLLLVLCFGFGILLGLLIALWQLFKLKLANRRLIKQIERSNSNTSVTPAKAGTQEK